MRKNIGNIINKNKLCADDVSNPFHSVVKALRSLHLPPLRQKERGGRRERGVERVAEREMGGGVGLLSGRRERKRERGGKRERRGA